MWEEEGMRGWEGERERGRYEREGKPVWERRKVWGKARQGMRQGERASMDVRV
jgi:hypothetical protein